MHIYFSLLLTLSSRFYNTSFIFFKTIYFFFFTNTVLGLCGVSDNYTEILFFKALMWKNIALYWIQMKQISGIYIYMRVTVGDVPVHPVLVSMSAHGAPVGPEYWRHCNVMKCTEIFQWCGRASRMNKLQKLLCTFTRSKSSQLSSSLDSIISFRCAVLFCEFKCWCCVPRWKNRMFSVLETSTTWRAHILWIGSVDLTKCV